MDKMDLLFIGKISSTFGIKGGLKLRLNANIKFSDLTMFKLLFIKDSKNQLLPYKINSLMLQKEVIVVNLDNLVNINQVEKFKGMEVYFHNNENLFSIEYSLLDYTVEYNYQAGKIIDQMFNGVYDLIKVQFEKNVFWIPLVDAYVEQRDDVNLCIIVKNVEGLK